MAYLEGNLIKLTKSSIKSLVGKKVCFLPISDIDKSGRGYYFPRYAIVDEVINGNIVFHDGNSYHISQIKELVIMGNND